MVFAVFLLIERFEAQAIAVALEKDATQPSSYHT
jgi:hypothetical protein